jgi:hypothetical protein
MTAKRTQNKLIGLAALFRLSEILLTPPQITRIIPAVPCPEEGRYHGRRETLARDAVDAAVPSCALRAWTSGADADGEVVWS